MAVDLGIGLILVALAGSAIFASRLLSCVLLFIVFGLIVTLAWVRLQAIDLALAEAAIGAGLTGTLLLYSLIQNEPQAKQKIQWRWWFIAGSLGAVAALVLLFALPEILQQSDQYPLDSALLAQQQVPNSGVSHPVTAVLLNFRAWDTLLELAVVLLALLGIRQLQSSRPAAIAPPWPLLMSWSRTLAPGLFVVGAYLLWRGKSAPGGAFQAGALLAAGAVLLRLNRVLPALQWSHWLVRSVALMGLAVFTGVAVSGQWFGEGWLYFPRAFSGSLILAIELAATASIALALTLMVVGDDKDLHQ